MTKVSVCMAVHNGAKYLRQQIDSILPQLAIDDELIVSDDFSTDESLEIIAAYGDGRIKILPPARHHNPVQNFEYALMHCRREIIFLSDQDDIWHANKIARMKAALQRYDLVVCDCRVVNETLDELYPSFFHLNRSGQGLVRNFIKSSFMGCCMAFNREVLHKALPFPKGTPMHDQWIGLVAERYFNVYFINEVLVDHRRHLTNYSSTGGRSKFSLPDKLNMRFQLARKLFFRL